MATGSVVALASTLRRMRDDAGLQVLRADLLPVLVAVLHEHLGGTTRVLAAVDLIEALTEDLAELRGAGFALPRTAADYVSEWVRQGILVRRASAGREETVELSPSAQQAVRFVAGLEAPRSSVTRSRLANVADLVGQLARDTDPEQESRLEALTRERDRIASEIEAVEQGRFTPVADDLAIERLAEILRLAAEIPGDFARVSADFEALNRELRERIINQPGSRGEVLDSIFDGVDLIEESDAGRSFAAFYALLLDPSLSATLDDAVIALMDRDFATALTRQEAYFLRHLLTALQSESGQVRTAMTGFSRSLRRFVESHAYREHRRLADALATARSAAWDASRVVRPQDGIGADLPGSSMALGTIGTWTLRNPADVRTAEPVAIRDSGPLDLEALREQVRESEIDFAELRAAVVDTLNHQPIATVGDVLALHPATQGLASVVGLLVLAESAGSTAAGVETLSWTSRAGQQRSVRAHRYLFREVPDEWRTR